MPCYAFPMRYMGIDYGSKRVGVAFSNEDGTMAFPHSVLRNDASLIKSLVALAEREHAEAIVIGASRNLEGEANPIQERIDECILDLTLELGVPIHSEPEVYSTQEAIREQGRNDMTDASAASIILNSYLTRHRS
jgi:putative holliday junction resolvase